MALNALDPSTAWRAKLNRAKQHLQELQDLRRAFEDSQPYTVVEEETDVPERLAYRLHIHHEPPVELSTTIGDVLHNLTSALDALAYGVAENYLGRPLDDSEQARVDFPISKNGVEFDNFFVSRRRDLMFGERERAALRKHQSFWIAEELVKLGGDLPGHHSEADEFRFSSLNRLRMLSNIDKHRRLAVTAWWPSLLYWGASPFGNRRLLRGDGTLTDGSILCYFEGHDIGGSPLSHEFALTLKDDPGHDPSWPQYTPADCVQLLTSFKGAVELIVGVVCAELATTEGTTP